MSSVQADRWDAVFRHSPPFGPLRPPHGTCRVKAAAEELCLTASALSHQIKALEGFLDTQLFERSGNRIALTLTGAAYAGKLTHLLDSMQDETDAVRENRGVLRGLATPGFAAPPAPPYRGAPHLRLVKTGD